MNVSRPEVGRKLVLRGECLDPPVRALFPPWAFSGPVGTAELSFRVASLTTLSF